MAKTDEEYNALLNQRDSKQDFIAVHNRINDVAADARLLKRTVESLYIEMRDIRTETKNTQTWVEDNAKVTREVRDILTSFHIIGSFAKWLTTVAAAIAFAWGITDGWFHK